MIVLAVQQYVVRKAKIGMYAVFRFKIKHYAIRKGIWGFILMYGCCQTGSVNLCDV